MGHCKDGTEECQWAGRQVSASMGCGPSVATGSAFHMLLRKQMAMLSSTGNEEKQN